ncbi:Ccc1 family [Sesbania bispinosa]|nr:Ccc1 family [Sesbania bispinosa]
MASLEARTNGISNSYIEIPIHANGVEPKPSQGVEEIDYSQRGQWLRAAVLGANDGLVSVASLMMGVGAVKEDINAMLLAGFAGLVAGACSMAIGENHKIRMGVVAAVASLALLVFGGVGAVIGKTPVRRSCVRVLIGGWMAMAITFGLTKLIGSFGI